MDVFFGLHWVFCSSAATCRHRCWAGFSEVLPRAKTRKDCLCSSNPQALDSWDFDPSIFMFSRNRWENHPKSQITCCRPFVDAPPHAKRDAGKSGVESRFEASCSLLISLSDGYRMASSTSSRASMRGHRAAPVFGCGSKLKHRDTRFLSLVPFTRVPCWGFLF